ncbi:MAG TPA: hypothetical protein VED24_04110 [Candidatus Acidoferrum sp.]|nr:hypothetical protein [Candidatus Acidoferrum sp.]
MTQPLGQTSLLQMSAGKDPARFTVSVERTVNLGHYESIRVGLAESFDTSADKDQAYRSLLTKVDSWTSAMKPETSQTGHGTPGIHTENTALSTSKPAGPTLETLRERLAGWLMDLEIMDGFDGFSVKPRRYLGQTWESVNQEIRALGGKWIRGQGPGDGSWRIKK